MVATAIGAAAGIGGSLISSSASNKASKAAASAAAANTQLARDQFENTRQTIDPFLAPAYGATSALANRLGVNPMAAAAGGNMSGGSPDRASPQGFDYYNPQPQIDYQQILRDNPDVMAWAMQDGDPTGDAEQWYRDYGAKDIASGARPDLQYTTPYGTAPQPGARPGVGMAPAPPSVQNYTQSADYNIIRDQALRAVNASNFSRGTGFSSGRLKALQDRSGDIAAQDVDRYFQRQMQVYGAQRDQFNTDRSVANQTYDSDRGYDRGVYMDDRGFQTGRFDEQTNNMFRLANQGLGAAGTLSGAGQSMVNTISNSNNSAASATGNAALLNAQNINGLISGGMRAYGASQNPMMSGYSTPATPFNGNYGYTGGGMGGLY